MPIRAVIVEDEPLSRQYICALLRNVPGIEILDNAATEQEAISKINSLNPDLVLLDLELHSGTGLEVARNIVSPDTNIIFTTALDHQATRIIRISGMPFLQKPIDAQELEMIILHSQRRNKALKAKQFSYLLETLGNNNLPVHIHIPEEQEGDNTIIDDMLIIQSPDKTCKITKTDNSIVSTCLSLKDFEEMLCEFNFFRTNVSTIVNMKHVETGILPGAFITMNNGERVELSLKKRDAFMQKLNGLS